MSAINIVNAKKNFASLQALGGIDLEVKKGEFFGLLGPNGAGKTTLIHSIVGLCRLSEGSISVEGLDVRRDYLKTHALVGFSPQEINLDRFFPIRKILMYQAGFFGSGRKQQKEIVEKLLHQFHLEEKSHLPYYKLSGGMQKRLLIAKAMVGNPRVLILDEPTAGVDVEQRNELWEYLRNLNRDGTTIVLTTHYIDEAEELCGRIGIIHLGKIREMGKPVELIDRYCEKRVIIKTSKEIDATEFKVGATGRSPLHIDVNPDGITTTIHGSSVGQIINKIHQIISKDPDCRILDLNVEKGSLEDVFLKVTGSKIEEDTRKGNELNRISNINPT